MDTDKIKIAVHDALTGELKEEAFLDPSGVVVGDVLHRKTDGTYVFRTPVPSVEAATSIALNRGTPGPVGPIGPEPGQPGYHPGPPGDPPDYVVPAPPPTWTPKGGEAVMNCYLCGGVFPADKKVNWRGHWICPGCFSRQGVEPVYDVDRQEWPKKEIVDFVLNPTVFKRPQPPDHDPVNHPSHYTGHPSGVECIEIVEHMGFSLGNAIKYIWRADSKGNAVEDLQKAVWYINREIQRRSQPQDIKEEALNSQNK